VSANSTTRIDSLRTGGSFFIQAPYGANRYVKLVSVDELGNVSASTAAAGPIATRQLLGPDVFAGAVGSAALADLAVINSKIGNLAVNDAKIANLNVSKLVSGTGTFDLLIAGRLTTALNGARTEFNAAGFYRFDANGNTLVAIDSTGNLLTGTFRTALTGRRIEMTSAGNAGEITLYAPDGRRGFIRSYSQATGQEAIQFGMSIQQGAVANVLWNRITYNASAAGEYATYRSGTHEFVYDATSPNNGRFVIYGTEARGESVTRIRMQINDEGTDIWYPIAKQFVLWDRSDASGVQRARMWVRNPSITMYWFSGGSFDFVETQSGTDYTRHQMGDTEFWWRWPSSTSLYKHWTTLTRNEDSTGNGSALFRGMNAWGYGYTMEWRSTNTGSSGRLEFKDAVNGVYVPLHASEFSVRSTRASKKSFRDVEPMTGKMRGVKVHKWKRNRPTNLEDPDTKEKYKPEKNAPVVEPDFIGPVAEELATVMPDVLDRDENDQPVAINLNSAIWAVLKYIQEVDDRLQKVEAS
jgi:hypothetical protein